jgi:hypothetical protein
MAFAGCFCNWAIGFFFAVGCGDIHISVDIVFSIERPGKNMNWKRINIRFGWEKIVTITTIIGIAFLFLWIIIQP